MKGPLNAPLEPNCFDESVSGLNADATADKVEGPCPGAFDFLRKHCHGQKAL